MAKIIDGKVISAAAKDAVREEVAKLKEKGIETCLAVIIVGDDPASDVAGALNADMEVVWLDRFPYDGRYNGNEKVHRVKSVKEYFHL